MKPIDKAIFGMVSESSGRNESGASRSLYQLAGKSGRGNRQRATQQAPHVPGDGVRRSMPPRKRCKMTVRTIKGILQRRHTEEGEPSH